MKQDKKILTYIKANRRGSRNACLENSFGFYSVLKIHKNKKAYNRKKQKININNLNQNS